MPPSIEAAKAGVTTGEWGQVLREVFGEYRAPTGIQAKHTIDEARLEDIRRLVAQTSGKLGRTLTFVVGKPGLDGHSNGAEQIAVRATDVGMDVVYDGIRLTPQEIVEQAKQTPSLVDAKSDYSDASPEVQVAVDRSRAADLGVRMATIGNTLRLMVAGDDEITTYREAGEQYPVTIRVLESQRNDIDMVGKLTVTSATGQPVLLPRAALGIASTGSADPGLQKTTDTFDEIDEAPSNGYITDAKVPVAVGDRLLVRSRVICSLGVPLYAKIEVLSIEDGSIHFKVLADQNCGYRGLQPGFPDK